MLDKSFIGYESDARFIDVEKGQLKFFAKATGETNPVYFDEDAARAAGHPTLPAPPTFQFSLEMLAPDPRGMLGPLVVDIGKLLHGEQKFEFERQIYAGDTIKLVSRIVDIYDKKGGALEFIVTDTFAENQHAKAVGKTRTVTVVRNA